MNLYLISDGSYADTITEHSLQTVIVVIANDTTDEIVQQAAKAVAKELDVDLCEICVNMLSECTMSFI